MIYGSINHDYSGRKKAPLPRKGRRLKSSGTYTFDYEPPRRNAVKSLETTACDTTKKESPKYTGTLIKGISTMHKSNAVPILSNEEAEEHANMRR